MRLTARAFSAAALTGAVTGALLTGLAPAASATVLPEGGYTRHVHKSGFGDVTVTCPAGYHATGGGVAVDHDEEVATLHSRPTMDGRGWEGSAWGEVERPERPELATAKKTSAKKASTEDTEVEGLPITVYAVCALG